MTGRFLIPTLGLCVLTMPAFAHHSTAEYDRSVVHEIDGELVDVRWQNPHVGFTVRVTDVAGATENWQLSTLPFYLLERQGLSKSMFTAGERVQVAGWPSTKRAATMIVTNLLPPAGKELLFYPAAKIRWASEASGGNFTAAPVSRARRDIYRVWSVADLGAYLDAVRAIDIQLTPAAAARMEGSPRIDVCLPQGMPGLMLNPLPIEFVDRGEHIDMRLTSFGVVRRVDMTARPDAQTIPLSDLGYSAGRWIDGTLEVRTTRVGWPYVDDAGKPQTENVEIVERFELVDEGNLLRYTQIVTDPESLVEPMTVSWDFIDIGESIDPLRCD